ncbi:MAG TPA: ACT domain-containing protein [Fimbriimonadaceae bacterium]|nr:ACT domain-containing protein [Fimbriimonadaceae bacterium]
MARDITVIMEDRPGSVAKMGEAIAKAGISIEGWCGTTCDGKGVIHVLVDDAKAARKAIEGAGLKVSAERDVLVLEVEDKPGVLAKFATKIAKAGVNVDFGYLATHTRLVIGAADIKKAREAVPEAVLATK